ncbi:MAG: hypothetical protein JXR95_05460 [Deltaproteobacteria bacterium]|nr:hypothetical protein [Deltaproteobacteria bacterium]
MFSRINTVVNVFMLILLFSCSGGDAKNEDQPQKEAVVPPINTDAGKDTVSKDASSDKTDKAKKPTVDTVRPDRLVDQINRLNKCLQRSVKSIKKEIDANHAVISRTSTAELKKMGKICERNYFDIINNYNDLTFYYRKYFLAAAHFLDSYFLGTENLSLPMDAPGKQSVLEVEKSVLNIYNKYALKNNDLVGVSILEKYPKQEKSTVDLRTYSDESARLGEFITKEIRKWNRDHSFDLVPGADRPSWMFSLRREFTAIVFLETQLKKKSEYFKTISCIRGFAKLEEKKEVSTDIKRVNEVKKIPAKVDSPANLNSAKEKPASKKSEDPVLTCKAVEVKTGMVIKNLDNWVKEWKKQLSNSIRTWPVVDQGFKNKTFLQYSTLNSSLSSLPPKLK